MSSRFVSFLFLLLCCCTTAVLAGEKPWNEVRSPHFHVLTNGSLGEARRVAQEFEQMRYVFATQFPKFRLESGAPLLIFAARDEDTAKALEPGRWKMKGVKPAGVFHEGWEKQYVMVRLDTWGEGAHEAVYHEYVHSILHMNVRWLPVWLNEGIAEFYAYTRFEGQKILIGAPTERYRILSGRTPIPIETLIAVDHHSPYYHDEDKVQMFYGESWALVHFMTFGPGMEGGKRLDQFFSLMQEGMEQKKVFRQVFGDFKEMDNKLGQYMRLFAFTASVFKNAPHINEREFTSLELTIAETKAELGGFLLWNHDVTAARRYIEQALKEDPKLGLAHENMGFLHFADGDAAAALDEFSQAYALDGTLYRSLFAKTMLSPVAVSDSPADQTAFHDALLKVLELNRQFAPALVQLARLALRRNDPATALWFSRRAEALEPARAGYHLLVGQILLRMGRDNDSAAFAKFVADRWVGSDHDEAVELWNKIPAEKRPAAELRSDSATKDTQTIEGTVKSVSCGEQDQGWTFVLVHDGQPLIFHRKGSFEVGMSDTIWYGEDHFTLCHHLEGMRAVVRYRSPSDASYAGNVAEIGIRDDLPVLASTTAEEKSR
jgi:Tfp pilus assembly protein PilF